MIGVSVEMNRDKAIWPWRSPDRSLGPKRRAERNNSNQGYSPSRAKCRGYWRILVHIVNHPRVEAVALSGLTVRGLPPLGGILGPEQLIRHSFDPLDPFGSALPVIVAHVELGASGYRGQQVLTYVGRRA